LEKRDQGVMRKLYPNAGGSRGRTKRAKKSGVVADSMGGGGSRLFHRGMLKTGYNGMGKGVSLKDMMESEKENTFERNQT